MGTNPGPTRPPFGGRKEAKARVARRNPLGLPLLSRISPPTFKQALRCPPRALLSLAKRTKKANVCSGSQARPSTGCIVCSRSIATQPAPLGRETIGTQAAIESAEQLVGDPALGFRLAAEPARGAPTFRSVCPGENEAVRQGSRAPPLSQCEHLHHAREEAYHWYVPEARRVKGAANPFVSCSPSRGRGMGTEPVERQPPPPSPRPARTCMCRKGAGQGSLGRDASRVSAER